MAKFGIADIWLRLVCGITCGICVAACGALTDETAICGGGIVAT